MQCGHHKNQSATRQRRTVRSPIAPRHCRWPRTIWSIWLPSPSSLPRFCSPFWLQGIFDLTAFAYAAVRNVFLPSCAADLCDYFARVGCGHPLRRGNRLGIFPGPNCLWACKLDQGPLACPLWVKSRHVQRKRACPLYPRKRTCAAQQKGSLFDHLVGTGRSDFYNAPTACPYRDFARPRLRPSGAARRRSGTYYWRETPCYPGTTTPVARPFLGCLLFPCRRSGQSSLIQKVLAASTRRTA